MSFLGKQLTEFSWKSVLGEEFSKPYFKALEARITERQDEGALVFPKKESIFAALNLTPFNDVRVVILGQDPYHGEGQAMGLSFSVPEGVNLPPSLRNMVKEIEEDIGETALTSGDLRMWSQQGVLLLNTSLTVEAGKAGSHSKLGWMEFTDAAISALSELRSGIVFVLWGGHAQKKTGLINTDKHLVLAGPHPSPLSAYRGFFGCKHFSNTNAYLVKNGSPPIVW